MAGVWLLREMAKQRRMMGPLASCGGGRGPTFCREANSLASWPSSLMAEAEAQAEDFLRLALRGGGALEAGGPTVSSPLPQGTLERR